MGSRVGAGMPRIAAVGALLFLSGAASLALEVVWMRALRLHFGTSTLAVSTILFSYMLGLGLGGLAGGVLAPRLKRPIRTYAWLELAIALYAVAVPTLFSTVLPGVSAAVANSSPHALAMARFVTASVLLLVPTVLMGATLPLLVQATVRERGELGGRAGLLYGLNTLGAVAGVLAAVFVLFPAFGLWGTGFVAAGADVVVALGAFALALGTASAEKPATRDVPRMPRATLPVVVYATVGFTALAYEVSWTRALSMVLGSSIHAFAVMLATFLAGIALGSLLGRRLADRVAHPHLLYAAGIAALGLLAGATSLGIGRLPDLFLVLTRVVGLSPGAVISTQFGVSAALMLPAALVLGGLFPIVVRCSALQGVPAGTTVGHLYFANTLGSALGAFLTAFWLIPLLGLQHTLGLAIALDLLAGCMLLLAQTNLRLRVPLAAGAALAALVCATYPPSWDPERLVEGVFWRTGTKLGMNVTDAEDPTGFFSQRLLFYRDGLSATISVHKGAGGIALRTNGKTDASDTVDLETQVLLAHVPILFGPRPEHVLVIGLGSGVTTTSAGLYEFETLHGVEIEPAVIDAARLFEHVHATPLDHSLGGLRIEDARGYLARSPGRYDLIISEPSNPWISGVSDLFTHEFFELAHDALRPGGGRFAQWLELYGLEPGEFGTILRALRAEFPFIYGFASKRGSSDVILLAGDEPLESWALPHLEDQSAAIRADLGRVGVFSTPELWSLMHFTPEEADMLAATAPEINSDANLYVELRAPWNLSVSFVASHWQGWASQTRGIEPMLRGVPTGTVGEVAEAYARARGLPHIARRLLDRPGLRGTLSAALAQASIAASSGEAQAAARLFDLAVEFAPASFQARLLRGHARLAQGDAQGALEDVEAALAAHPEDTRAGLVRVAALTRLGRAREAVAAIEPLRRDPYLRLHPKAYLQLARAAVGGGQLELGLELMSDYAALAPHTPENWNAVAGLAARTGRADRAANARRRAKSAVAFEVRQLHRQARLAVWMGEPERAQPLLEEALGLDPGYTDARIELETLRGR